MEAFGQHALADDMLMQKADLLARTGDVEAAIQTYLEVPLMHPTSFLGARSMVQAASLQARFVSHDEALDTYQRILLGYPGSLLIPQVREAIRLLRGDGV